LADRKRGARGTAAEQLRLADRKIVMGALRARKHRIDGGEDARTVCVENIEGAGSGKAFKHPLVDRVRVDARREIGQID
jgi:hypothetical protein